jgi:hypothetical protein
MEESLQEFRKGTVMSDITPLIEWIQKRETIRMAKETGLPPPWTTDPILQEFRFCNVRRKDDRVSKWLIKHILLEKAVKKNIDTFLQFSTLCRMVNWPPTINALLRDKLFYPGIKAIEWGKIGRKLDVLQKRGKAWTSAYMIHGDPYGGEGGKGDYVCKCLKEGFAEKMPAIKKMIATKSLEAVATELTGIKSLGGFLAGQVVADWSYTSLLNDSKELYTWAPLGPGSRRGYNRLLGKENIKEWPEEKEFISQLIKWRKEIIKKLGPKYKDLTLHDVQNCLCEFDKYERARLGQGRPKSRYAPETRF